MVEAYQERVGPVRQEQALPKSQEVGRHGADGGGSE